MADLNSLHIGNGIVGARSAIEGNAKVTCARFGLGGDDYGQSNEENGENNGPADARREHEASSKGGSIKEAGLLGSDAANPTRGSTYLIRSLQAKVESQTAGLFGDETWKPGRKQ